MLKTIKIWSAGLKIMAGVRMTKSSRTIVSLQAQISCGSSTGNYGFSSRKKFKKIRNGRSSKFCSVVLTYQARANTKSWISFGRLRNLVSSMTAMHTVSMVPMLI